MVVSKTRTSSEPKAGTRPKVPHRRPTPVSMPAIASGRTVYVRLHLQSGCATVLSVWHGPLGCPNRSMQATTRVRNVPDATPASQIVRRLDLAGSREVRDRTPAKYDYDWSELPELDDAAAADASSRIFGLSDLRKGGQL